MKRLALRKRTALVAGLAIITILIGWWAWAANQNDMRVTNRLLGKWGAYLPTSPDNSVPYHIVEWLPNGRFVIYAPDGFRLHDDSSNLPNLDPSWRIHNGDFIHQTTVNIPKGTDSYVTEDIYSKSAERFRLDWMDENTVRMDKMPGNKGNEAIVYRRISD